MTIRFTLWWLLKRVETQHQMSYICTSIHVGMMENLILMRKLKSFMKGIRKYYRSKHKLNLILINGKRIMKPREGKRREEYMVLGIIHTFLVWKLFVLNFIVGVRVAPFLFELYYWC